MKLEQASKVEWWEPTRLTDGEGRVGRQYEIGEPEPFHRGSEHGMQGSKSSN